MAKIIAVCLSFTLLHTNASRGVDDSQIAELVRQENGARDLSRFNAEVRFAMIGRLKQKLVTAENAERNTITRLLLLLNDEETLSRLVDAYHAGDHVAESALELYAGEAVLSHVVNDVHEGSRDPRIHGDVIRDSIQSTSALISLGAIGRSPTFPADTCTWARAAAETLRHGGSAAKSIVSKYRTWWEKNKVAVTTNRFSEARWLPDSAAAEKRIDVALPSSRTPTSTGVPEPSSPIPRRDSAARPPVSITESNRTTVWIALSASAITSVLGLFLFKKRR